MIGASMAVRPPRSRGPVLMMISAIRRLGGTLIYAPDNLAGVYVDNVGTTPVTAVGDLIGLITDKSYGGQLGVELVTVPTVMGAAIDGTTAVTLYVVGAGMTVGKSYRCTYKVSGYTGSNDVGFSSGSFAAVVGASRATANGTYSFVGVAVNPDINVFSRPISNTANFSEITVREVPGNHATQSAVASKPSFQRVNGRNVISFDGSNDFLTTGITTGNEGWVCAGVTPANTTTGMSVVNAGEGTPTIPGVWLFASGGGSWSASAANGTVRTQVSRVMTGVGPQVVSMGWDASNISVGVDNVEASTARTGSCASGANVLRIGQYQGSSVPFNGSMHAIAYTSVLPSAADRATIRNGIAALQGRTL